MTCEAQSRPALLIRHPDRPDLPAETAWTDRQAEAKREALEKEHGAGFTIAPNPEPVTESAEPEPVKLAFDQGDYIRCVYSGTLALVLAMLPDESAAAVRLQDGSEGKIPFANLGDYEPASETDFNPPVMPKEEAPPSTVAEEAPAPPENPPGKYRDFLRCKVSGTVVLVEKPSPESGMRVHAAAGTAWVIGPENYGDYEPGTAEEFAAQKPKRARPTAAPKPALIERNKFTPQRPALRKNKPADPSP